MSVQSSYSPLLMPRFRRTSVCECRRLNTGFRGHQLRTFSTILGTDSLKLRLGYSTYVFNDLTMLLSFVPSYLRARFYSTPLCNPSQYETLLGMDGGGNRLSISLLALIFGSLILSGSTAYAKNGRGPSFPLTRADVMYKRQSAGDTNFNWSMVSIPRLLLVCLSELGQFLRLSLPIRWNGHRVMETLSARDSRLVTIRRVFATFQ